MFGVIPEFTGNCHGSLGIWVDKVSVASFTAAIHESDPLQFGYQSLIFGGIDLTLFYWSHNGARVSVQSGGRRWFGTVCVYRALVWRGSLVVGLREPLPIPSPALRGRVGVGVAKSEPQSLEFPDVRFIETPFA